MDRSKKVKLLCQKTLRFFFITNLHTVTPVLH